MAKKKSLAEKEKEVEKKVYNDEIRDIKKQKNTGLPLFVWYFIILAILLIITLVMKSRALLTVTAVIFFGSLLIFTLIQFIDCLRMIFKEGEPITQYALWLVFIVLFPFIGAFFYWLSKK